jgi:peptidoglycan/LPS O-acetylase OafA/YrhL
MRALAVLLVMFGHCGYVINGAAGVDVFFVLSGYLITALLLEERIKRGRIGFGNFYMRRALRLLPALFAAMAVSFLIVLLCQRSYLRNYGSDALLAAGYCTNWAVGSFHRVPRYLAHTWSLSIEEQFYLVWPLCVLALFWLFGRGKRAALLCLVAALALTCYREWLQIHGAGFARVYYGTDTRGDALLAGAALAFWRPHLPRRVAAVVAWLAVIALTLHVYRGYVYSIALEYRGVMHVFGEIQNPYFYRWLFPGIALVGILNDRDGLLARILSFKPLVWIGAVSYGLYLFHFPIVHQLSVWHYLPRQQLAIVFPMTFGLAAASYYLLERPFLRLKDRFRPAGQPLKVA